MWKYTQKLLTQCRIDQLQCALDSLNEWAVTWQLLISVNKCCIFHIGSDTSCRPLCINGSVLPIVTTCRDLGVLITNDLSPSVHIDSVVAKVYQRASAMLRCFVSRHAGLLIKACAVYVRPVLEFSCYVIVAYKTWYWKGREGSKTIHKDTAWICESFI